MKTKRRKINLVGTERHLSASGGALSSAGERTRINKDEWGIEAVLLDFDHTLAHLGSFIRWEDARRALLAVYGAGGVPESFLQAHEGALSLYRDVAASAVLPEPELCDVQRRASRVLEAFETEAVARTFVLPAAIELVHRLPELGLRAGIVSSNAVDVVAAVLERDGIAPAFDAVLGRGDVLRLKPSPEGLLRCCDTMRVAPERCVYIGDSVSDIEAARAAGMAGFGVRGGMASDAELADAAATAVFDDVGGLLSVLEGQGRAVAGRKVGD